MKLPKSLVRAIGRAVRYRHIRTVAEIAGAVILLSGTAGRCRHLGGTKTPSAPAGATIRACASSKTGAVSILLRAHARCRRGTVAVNWNTALFGAKTNKAIVGAGGATCTIGAVILTAGKTAAAGTLPANGQKLLIKSYDALYSLLGTEYGGNGTTTFALPDLRNAAPDGLTYSICASTGIYP